MVFGNHLTYFQNKRLLYSHYSLFNSEQENEIIQNSG